MEQPVLETERLILRPFEERDAPRISKLAGEKVISDTTLRIPHPYSEARALEWIGSHEEIRDIGRALFYAVELKDKDLLIGSVGIDIDNAHSRAEIGYWIGKDYWNEGYATEAAAKLLEYSFNELGFHKVTAHHFERNRASGRILEKLGMKREGLLRSHIRNAGEWEDIVQYGILDVEYEEAGGTQRSG
jgi:RimJ/RimL family protein N-acetyltransferase